MNHFNFKCVSSLISSKVRNGKLDLDQAKVIIGHAKEIKHALSTKDNQKLVKAVDKFCKSMFDSET